MSKQPQIALLIETSNAYARGILKGIHEYLREHGPWAIYLPEQGRGDVPPHFLRDWRGDGIIARIENERIAQAVQAAGVPTVNVSATDFIPGIPCVETDNRRIAQLAFEHFHERGFQNLAFCGNEQFLWSRERQQAFEEFAQQAGCGCISYNTATHSRAGRQFWERELQHLIDWLRGLPKPCGLMANYDIRGWQVLEACRQAGIRVPDEIAVVGVDNDELLCSLSSPPLSSVAPDTHRTGYRAAQLLTHMLAGGAVTEQLICVPPVDLIGRLSSDVRATDDADVAAAVRFIREHACAGIKVADVLAVVPGLSRRVFELRFQRAIGHTPHEEIHRRQVQRALELLTQTDLPLRTIAEKSGFKHEEYLSAVIKDETGQSPGRYRANVD